MYLFKGSVNWNFASICGVSSRVVFNGVSHSTWYECTQHTVKFRKKAPGPLFAGAYVRREICIIKSVGLDCSGEEIYHFRFVLHCIRGQIPSTSPPGGLYSEGRFNGGFFALRFWGAYIWRGLYMEGLIFGILRYYCKKVRRIMFTMSSELLSLACWSCFLIVSRPSGCHAVLLHQDSQIIMRKWPVQWLKENTTDKNWLELTQLFKE